MKLKLLFIIIFSIKSFGQEIKYNLMIKSPCSEKVEYSLLYHLEKSGKKYFKISDSIGTMILPEIGEYLVIAEFDGISQITNLKKGGNIDTLYTKKIQVCYEPVSHPSFSGYCCCEEICEGLKSDYYNDGTLRMEGNFKNGQPVGKLKLYHSNGIISEIRIYNKKGVLRRTKKYDKKGKRI
ncbi:hypothetical protein [Zunongwangia sp.]|uniref:hypothetical protein n=1 Tax=Zunongwangia sp. TaxID=1965325 RepID=UPI003AA9D13E